MLYGIRKGDKVTFTALSMKGNHVDYQGVVVSMTANGEVGCSITIKTDNDRFPYKAATMRQWAGRTGGGVTGVISVKRGVERFNWIPALDCHLAKIDGVECIVNGNYVHNSVEELLAAHSG